MSDDLVKMCRRLSIYAHAQISSADLERIAGRIEELEAANKRLNDQMDAIEEMGTESLNALPDCLMRLAPALVENGELKAKLARAEWLLNDALVQLREGKIRTRRNRADLIDKFIDELKGNTDD